MTYFDTLIYLSLIEGIPFVLFFRSFYPPFIFVVFSNAIVLMKMDSHFVGYLDPFALAGMIITVQYAFIIVGTEYFIFWGIREIYRRQRRKLRFRKFLIKKGIYDD